MALSNDDFKRTSQLASQPGNKQTPLDVTQRRYQFSPTNPPPLKVQDLQEYQMLFLNKACILRLGTPSCKKQPRPKKERESNILPSF